MSIPTREEVESLVYEYSESAGREPLIDADAALRAEIERLRAALVAAARHHESEASRCGSMGTYCLRDHMGPYHDERARVLRAAAEGQS